MKDAALILDQEAGLSANLRVINPQPLLPSYGVQGTALHL